MADAEPVPAGARRLLADWTGPYGGVPPFDRVEIADLEPALEEGMRLHLAQVDAIAGDPAPATFENTIAALERAGRALARVEAVFYLWSANLKSPAFRTLEARVSPRLAAFDDRVIQNAALFARIDAVRGSPELATLSSEQRRLVERYWTDYVRLGARLSPADKARLTATNQQLARAQTRFAQNALADEEAMALVLDDAAALAGVPAGTVAGYAADAADHDLPERWRVANTRSAIEPLLAFAADRRLRERAWRMWTARGDTGGPTDNNDLVVQILRLRADKARLLGYPTYADWHLADTMAGTPARALALSMQLWRPAVAQVAADVAAMQRLADADGLGDAIRPWDARFYAEALRRDWLDLDMAAVKPFLALEPVREAMFAAAHGLFGLRFAPARDVPVFHPDVSVFEVSGCDGEVIGLWYFDPFARPGKSSGAWMTSYRRQSSFDGAVLPLVSNNANFVKPPAGGRCALSLEDALTMFHEFGHALHALLSRVAYPRLSGTAVARDFVELPSQLFEKWLLVPETLARLTDEAGRAMPAALAARIAAAAAFNKGFSVVETQACAIADLRLHMAGDAPVEPRAFEAELLAELGMPAEVVMRHRLPHFSHVFAGEGYAAGYYGYLWAEVLDHDAFAAFAEAGDPWDPATAARLRDTVLAVGGTVDASDAWRAFRGRDPDTAALLRFSGFPVADAATAAQPSPPPSAA